MPESTSAYSPSSVEPSIYQKWEASGFFNPDHLPGSRGKPYVISMPPSNITGELHLGHALGFTVQDLLIRFHRMRGRRTLWLPGTDHAAIATQVVVERELKKEGIDRVELGRERFLERVWSWKEQYGSRINIQTRRLGASADWSRERFTMDDGLTAAVQEAFIRLYEDGLIYRGKRIVNWCPGCHTAISDLEVDHDQVPGHLWHLRYDVVGGGSIVVATTRPETMLGDTAIAVHPADERYASLVGARVRLPIVDREIPIIADHRIDRAFGTGAVKVTPAHDPLDYELGQTHHLDSISIIGEDGRIHLPGTEFDGQGVQRARERLVERATAEGWLIRQENYVHAVSVCSRSKDIIEPLLSMQWFVKTKPLAEKALAAVRSGKTKIVPERYTKMYYQWLENIRDWNISRQIWWGHRLPVWYHGTGANQEVRVSRTSPGKGWRQDEDTLDTWFSSGLWTFSTLGWPDRTADLRRYHPTDVLETAWDILFFWVARMMMMSLYLKKEVPFRTVYLHGLILDRHGKKMSRSKGNGIDPVGMIEKYGADALRLSVVIGNAPGQDFRMYEEKIAGYRNFVNKLWNVGRFVQQQPVGQGGIKPSSAADHWILSRLATVIDRVTAAVEGYQFSVAGQTLYDFVWHDLADWYVEWTKFSPNPAVLRHVYLTTLKLLHPFIPFVTEQLWSDLGGSGLLLIAAWPLRARSGRLGATFVRHQHIIGRLRIFRAHTDLADAIGEVVADADDVAAWQALSRVKLRPVERLAVGGGCQSVDLAGVSFSFPRAVVERFEGWREKERERLRTYVAQITKKLTTGDFAEHAPAGVVAGEREKLAAAEHDLRALE